MTGFVGGVIAAGEVMRRRTNVELSRENFFVLTPLLFEACSGRLPACRLYSAIERRETLSFNLLHKKDHARIQNKRFCSEEGIEVPWSDAVKGYEYAKGEYAVVTDEDFEKARVPATQTFDIRAFVPANDVEDLYFDEHITWSRVARAASKRTRCSATRLKTSAESELGRSSSASASTLPALSRPAMSLCFP